MVGVRVCSVVLLVLLAQLVVAPRLSVAGVVPELLLLLALMLGVSTDLERASVIGFGIGLFVDLNLIGAPLGLTALVYALAAGGANRLQQSLTGDVVWVPAAIAFGGTALALGAHVVMSELVGVDSLGAAELIKVVLVAGVLNAALALPGNRLLQWAWGPTNELTGAIA